MNKMKCSDCGIEMNHHADKVDYSIEPASADLEFGGGALQELHCCPGCGKTAIQFDKLPACRGPVQASQ